MFWRSTIAALFGGFLLVQCAMPEVQLPQDPGQHPAAFSMKVDPVEVGLEYWLFLPRDYGKETRKEWPLILFLHGAGERGDDLKLVKKHGIPKMVETDPDFPFIAISPQCPEGSWWNEQLADLEALLDLITGAYGVDESRIYLTGLSMGGQGTWELAVRQPDRYAAIAPICGPNTPVWFGCRLKDMPIWAFHGAKDEAVPLVASERMVAAINKCGGQARLTVYPDGNHEAAWIAAYANPELYAWLLEQRR